MSDTPRTVARWTTADIRPAEHGGFVTYGDYLTLKRQNAELLAALKEIRAMDFARSVMNGAAYKAHRIADEAIRRAEG